MIPQSRHLTGAVVLASAAHLAVAVLIAREVRLLPPTGGGGFSVVRVQLNPGGRIGSSATGVEAAAPAAASEPVVQPQPEPVAPPKPVPVAPQPRRVEKAVRDVAAAPPAKREVRPPQPKQSAAAPPAAAAPATAPGDGAAVATGPVAGAPLAGDGSGRPGAGTGGEAALSAAYIAQVRSWLDRHRTYPMAARRQRLEGSAVLWFRVDRGGRVLAYRLEKSSSHGVLDRAVLQMIERASPLPPLPADYPVDQPEFVIPIDFRLR